MRKFFDLNSPMMRMLSNLCDWILLNILTVVFSLPIITVGAATTAMYYCVGKQRRGEDNVFRDFWHGFKSNFWQSTGLWLLILVVTYVLGVSITTCFTFDVPGFKMIGYIVIAVAVVMAMIASWAFPLLSRFENTVMETIRNAFICVLTNFFRSLLMVIVLALPTVMLIWSGPQIVIYLVVIWYALAANFNMWLIRKPFKHLEDSSAENYGEPL